MALTAEDWFLKEYRQILEKTGETVLTYILKCGTDGKSPAVPIDEYLRNLPHESTANFNRKALKLMKENSAESSKVRDSQLKKVFNKTESEQIKSDPPCDRFDISLLYKSIQIACEKVAEREDVKWTTPSDDMEYLVWLIKQKRNDCIHKKIPIIASDEQFHEEIEKVTQLFVKVLEATRARYDRDENELTEKKDQVLEIVEDTRKEIQQRAANNSLPDFKTETNNELLDNLNSAKYIDPLHFLTGRKDSQVNVQTVFSRIDMTSEEASRSSGTEAKEVDYLELLNVMEGRDHPKILLIEGDAGSGKTTLITFILSEWLKGECDRRMKGLDHYDLLLRVVCREESISTLNDLLKQVLPESYLRYGSCLLPLIKKCKVLFLIDGLDEMTNTSNKLVTDILSEGKKCVKFTLVCTSRPEAILDFKRVKPTIYRTFHVRILGIPLRERTQLVMKHYEWLTEDVSGDTDYVKRIRDLSQIMEEIGWMELFRLPLNLLFVAAVFYYMPASLETTLTQPQLYHIIHKWCIEKLLHRLHPSLPDSKCLQKKVDTVLKVAYQIALKGVLQHRIYLTSEDESLLESCCCNQGLPTYEVMPTFYSLRRQVAYGVSKEQYYSPHKGFQDFFAAKHIIELLHEYKEGDIRRILKNIMPGIDLRLEPLRNVLCQLLGLLNREDSHVGMALEETVDLIKESGMEYSRDWLSVLADTVTHPALLERIAFHIKNRPKCKEIIEITDSTKHASTALLPLIPPCRVIVTLERTSDVADFRDVLAQHSLVTLGHHFVYPGPAATSGRLLQRFPLSSLEKFIGHLDAEHLPLLPRGLKELSLVVAGNDHCRSLLPALSEVRLSLLQLIKLRIHVPVKTVTPDAVTHPLPDGPVVSLILSGVGELEVETAWRVAVALCPSSKKEYRVIRFPGASLSLDGWLKVAKGLAEARVRVREGLRVPFCSITEDEARQLTIETKSLLKAKESRRVPEYVLWL